MKKFTISIAFSLTAHIIAFAALCLIFEINPFNTVPLGDGEGVTFVGVVGGGTTSKPNVILSKAKDPQLKRLQTGDSSVADSLRMTQPGSERISSGSASTGGSASGDPILAKIRRKIALNKYYPVEAKRNGIEGKPLVSFKIGSNGQIEIVEVTGSSGNEILDNAAIETVRRGAPYPAFDGEIKITIKYSLKE